MLRSSAWSSIMRSTKICLMGSTSGKTAGDSSSIWRWVRCDRVTAQLSKHLRLVGCTDYCPLLFPQKTKTWWHAEVVISLNPLVPSDWSRISSILFNLHNFVLLLYDIFCDRLCTKKTEINIKATHTNKGKYINTGWSRGRLDFMNVLLLNVLQHCNKLLSSITYLHFV